MTKITKKGNRGATSVLVIFMMMVLVTLGAFAITSANTNYKFSLRALDWNKMYYDLDASAEEYLYALDEKLARAEAEAYAYMENRIFSEADAAEIPAQIQKEIHKIYQENGLQDNIGSEIFQKVYMCYADTYLAELALSYPSNEVFTHKSDGFVDSMLLHIKLESGWTGTNDCGLSISVLAEPVRYAISESDGGMSITRESNDFRYKIESWYEYQIPKKEEVTQELWDGTFN